MIFWSAVAAAAAFVCSCRAEAYESGGCGHRTPKIMAWVE
jgi:hypothetical protein